MPRGFRSKFSNYNSSYILLFSQIILKNRNRKILLQNLILKHIASCFHFEKFWKLLARFRHIVARDIYTAGRLKDVFPLHIGEFI